MTEQYTFGAFIDRLGQGPFPSDCLHEIIEMVEVHIAAGGYGIGRICNYFRFYRFDELVLVIEEFVIPPAEIDQASPVTINNESAVAPFYGEMIAAAPFPGDRLSFREFKSGDLSSPVVSGCRG